MISSPQETHHPKEIPPEYGVDYLVFGGAFDPPTIAHFNLVQLALEQVAVSKAVLIVPTFNHVWKGSKLSDFSHRIEMLKLGVNDWEKLGKKVEIETIEQGLSGYTIDTLRALQLKYPEKSFGFLAGSDILKGFTSWQGWQEILKLTKLFIIPRDSDALEIMNTVPDELQPYLNSRIFLLETNDTLRDTAVSSTKAKADLRESGNTDLLDPQVLRYLLSKRLYQ